MIVVVMVVVMMMMVGVGGSLPQIHTPTNPQLNASRGTAGHVSVLKKQLPPAFV